uniref:Peptidase C1A papain C-terminal domain-containing protein n=1 Tax=Panagrolaimus davidi TaxID=227884 RepID=A0A914P3Z5_9BILA
MNFSIFLFFIFAVAAVNARSTFKKRSPSTTSISAEETFRLYEKAKKEVDELNKKYPGATFEINKFSFMSETEKKKYYATFPPTLPKFSNFATFDDENITAPDSYDYREYGKVTPVKNQQQCGSCYAFASTAAVESQFLIHSNVEYDLSEEYLLECDTSDDECVSGTAAHAFEVYKNIGVPQEDCDPYTATNGTCPDIGDCTRFFIGGYKALDSDEDKYPGLLYKYGPIAIAMNAGSSEFNHYRTGVLDIPLEDWYRRTCYTFGEEGYFRFKRGVNFCNFTLRHNPLIPYLSEATSSS